MSTVTRNIATVVVVLLLCAVTATSMVCAMNTWLQNDPTITLRGEAIRVTFTTANPRPLVGQLTYMHVVITGTFGHGNTTCLTPWWVVGSEAPRAGTDKSGMRVIVCGPPFIAIEQPVVFSAPGPTTVRLRLCMQSGALFSEEKMTFDVRPIPAAH